MICRFTTRRILSALLLATVSLLTLGADQAIGQCAVGNARFVYLHPYFGGKTWQLTGDSVIVSLPQAVCALGATDVQMTGSDASAIALLRNISGGLYLAGFTLTPRSGNCVPAYLVAQTPRSAGLTAVAPAPFYLAHQPLSSTDTVAIALSDGAAKVIIRYVATATSVLARADTLTLAALPGGAAVTGITGTAEQTRDADAGLWAFGTKGLLRYFARNGATWGTEQVFDISTTEWVTAMSDSFAGTDSGRVFVRNGASFVQQARPVTSAIRRITRKAAVGDNGTVLIRRGAAWDAYRPGFASYRQFNLVKFNDGSGVELLDSAWRYSTLTYSDSATKLSTIRTTAGVSYSPLDKAYMYPPGGMRPETVTVNISDPDSNFRVPQATFNGTVDLTHNATTTLNGSAPAMACTLGYTQLSDGKVLCVLTSDSVTFTARALTGAFDYSDLCYYWSAQQYRNSQRWYYQSGSVKIWFGADSLLIKYGSPPVTSLRPANAAAMGELPCTFASGGHITAWLPADREHRVTRILVFNQAGRLLYSVNPSPSASSVSMTFPKASASLLYVRFVLGNGTTATSVVPFVK
jgi:hypothetical protein